MLLRAPWAAALVACLAFSGCAQLFSGSDEPSTGSGPLARIAEFDFDENALDSVDDDPGSFLEQLLKVSFEYRHSGATVAASALEARFRDTSDIEVRKTLDRFTRNEDIRDGDVVTITGVHPLSGMQVRQGASILAERIHHDRDWLTVGGYPLPVEARNGGLAMWRLSGEGGVTFRMEDTTIDSGEDGVVEIDLIDVDASVTSSGTIEASVDARSLAFDVQAGQTGRLEVEVRGQADTGPVRGDVEGRGEASLDATMTFGFDSRGELTRASVRGEVEADATFSYRFEEDGEVEEMDSSDLDHPLFHDAFDESTDIDEDPSEAEAEALDLLGRLYGLDLAVGDRIRVAAEVPVPGGTFVFEYRVHVAGSGTRTVGGQAREALRVVEQVTMSLNGDDFGFKDVETTFWLDAKTYLPLLVEGSVSQSVDEDDVLGWLEDFGAEDAVDLGKLDLVFEAEYKIEATRIADGLAIPAPLGMWGLSPSSGIVVAAVVFVLVSGLGDEGDWEDWEDWEEPVEMVPSVAFSKDENADTLQVVQADAGAQWDHLSVGGDVFLQVAVNGPAENGSFGFPAGQGPITAGDILSFCRQDNGDGPVVVSIQDFWHNVMIAEFTYSSIRACEA